MPSKPERLLAHLRELATAASTPLMVRPDVMLALVEWVESARELLEPAHDMTALDEVLDRAADLLGLGDE